MVNSETPRYHKAEHDLNVYFFTEPVAQRRCFLKSDSCKYLKFYITLFMYALPSLQKTGKQVLLSSFIMDICSCETKSLLELCWAMHCTKLMFCDAAVTEQLS